MFAWSALIALALAVSVRAHGYVETIVADGAEYSGYLPFSDPYTTPVPDRIVRPIPGNGPVQDLTLIDLQCNGDTNDGIIGSSPAHLYATVASGAQMNLTWTTWPDSHKGPIITYMAAAPSDITAWAPGTDAVWFKVDESGKTADGLWAATDLLTASGSVYSFNIPSNLKAGQYIIRHEIIALHGAFDYPGVQIYPSCIQVEVTGSGTAFPTSFVSFPGAYTPDTPGIVFDIYTDPSLPYPIPGPTVWTGN